MSLNEEARIHIADPKSFGTEVQLLFGASCIREIVRKSTT